MKKMLALVFILGASPMGLLSAEAAPRAELTGDAYFSADATPALAADTEVTVTRTDAIENIEQMPPTAYAPDDLQTHATFLVASDANISSVAASAEKVAIEYREPAKLFGFIEVEAPITVAVSASGTATVEYPWYGFLLTEKEDLLSAKVQYAVSAVRDTSYPASTTATTTLSVEEQADLLDTVHGILLTELEVSI